MANRMRVYGIFYWTAKGRGKVLWSRYEKDKEKVNYVKMTPERAKEVIEKHIKGGNPVTEYTIGATQIAK